jgi:hypothetical protein
VVKAVSRAQRGRSGIEDARSALSARVASRTMTARRPMIATRSARVQRGLDAQVRRRPSRLRQRQRGVSDLICVAAGVIADPAKSRGRSRHGTAIDHVAGGVALVGRQKTPPDAPVRQLAAASELGESICPPRRVHIDRDFTRGKVSARGNTSRGGVFPPVFPPPAAGKVEFSASTVEWRSRISSCDGTRAKRAASQ